MSEIFEKVVLSLEAEGLSKTRAQIKSVTTTLEEMVSTLHSLDKNGVSLIDKLSINPGKAKDLKLTADALKSVSSSVSALTSAAKELKTTDIEGTIGKSAKAFAEYSAMLRSVQPLSKKQAESLRLTADLAVRSAEATSRLADAELKRARALREQQDAQSRAKNAESSAARVRLAEQEFAWRQSEALRKQQERDAARVEAEQQRAARDAARRAREQEREAAAAARANEQQLQSIERARYAARDLAQAYTRLAFGAAAIPAASILMFAEQEKAFANVQRVVNVTSDEDLPRLRQAFIDLSTETLQSFSELSEIASLGAQMDIPKESLADFTKAVSEFSTLTGISAETAAQHLGRLAKMMGTLNTEAGKDNGYEVLASQIAALGANSVATEQEILSMSTSIVSQGRAAGFTQNEILGLSATLSSLAVGKEWARGSLQRIFSKLNSAVADADDTTQAYARTLGMTTQEFDQMWRSDPSQLFVRLVSSVAQLDKVGKTQVLKDLGITASRDIEIISRLASNTGLLSQLLQESTEYGKDATFMQEAMGVMTETLSAKWIQFTHALQNASASLSGGFVPILKGGLDVLRGLLVLLDKMPGFVKTGIGAALGLTSIVFAVKAVQAGLISLTGSWMNMRRNMVAATGEAKITWGAVTGAWKQAKAQADLLTASATRASAAAAGTSASVGGLRGKMVAAAAGTRALGSAMSAFAAASSVAKAAVGGVGAVVASLAIGAIIEAASSALQEYSESLKTAKERTEAFLSASDSSTGASGLLDAMVKDTLAAARGAKEAMGELELSVVDSNGAYSSAAQGLYYYVDASGQVVEATKAAAAEQGLLKLKLGETTAEYLRQNALSASGIKDASDELKIFLADIGVDLNKFIQATISDPSGKAAQQLVDQYIGAINKIKQEVEAQRAELSNKLAEGGSSQFNGFIGAEDSDVQKLNELTLKLQMFADAIDLVRSMTGIGGLSESIRGAAAEAQIAGQGFGQAEEGLEGYGDAAGDAKDQTDKLKQALSNLYDQMFGMYDASKATQEALAGVYQSIQENGTMMDPNSEAGRANIDAIRAYMEALTQEAVMGAQELGLTGQEANAYVYQTLQDALAFMAEQGIDVSMFADIPNQIQGILEQSYSLGGVDYSKPVADLDAFGATVAAQVSQIQSLLATLGAYSAAYAKGGALYGRNNAKTANGLNRSQNADAQRWYGKAQMELTQRARARSTVGLGSAGGYKPSTGNSRSGFNSAGYAPMAGRSRGGGGGGGGGRGGSGGGGGGGSSARQKEVKSAEQLFEEFLSNLKSALDKALSSWWRSTTAADNYHKSLINLRKNVEATTKKIADLRNENQKLYADLLKNEQELHDAQFFNAIATKYGDTERMQSTNVDIQTAKTAIADKKRQIAENEREAAQLQQNQFALTGYTEAAIENRAALRGLQEQMVEMINAYAATGASTQEIEAYTNSLKQEFINQATQLGFNRNEVNYLAGAFDSLRTTIGTVPRDVDVNATDNGSIGRLQDAINGIHGSSPAITPYLDTSQVERQMRMLFDGMGNQVFPTGGRSTKYNRGGLVGRNEGGVVGFAGGGLVPGKPPVDKSKDNLLATTQHGTIYAIRSGEYVVSQPAVDFYGSGFMKAINTMQVPVVNVAPSTSNDSGIMTLNPQQFNMLVQAVTRKAAISIDGRSVSRSIDSANVANSSRGMW